MKNLIALGVILLAISINVQGQSNSNDYFSWNQGQNSPLGVTAQTSLGSVCQVVKSIFSGLQGVITKNIVGKVISIKVLNYTIEQFDVPTGNNIQCDVNQTDSFTINLNGFNISLKNKIKPKAQRISFNLVLGVFQDYNKQDESYIAIQNLLIHNFITQTILKLNDTKVEQLLNTQLLKVVALINNFLNGDKPITIKDWTLYSGSTGQIVEKSENNQAIYLNLLISSILVNNTEVCKNFVSTTNYTLNHEQTLISSQFVYQILCLVYQAQLLPGKVPININSLTTTTLNILFPTLYNQYPGKQLFLSAILSRDLDPQFYFRAGRVEVAFPVKFLITINTLNTTNTNYSTACLSKNGTLDPAKCVQVAEIDSYPMLTFNLWLGAEGCVVMNIQNLFVQINNITELAIGGNISQKQFQEALNGAVIGLLPTINTKLNFCNSSTINSSNTTFLSDLIVENFLQPLQSVMKNAGNQSYFLSYNGFEAIGVQNTSALESLTQLIIQKSQFDINDLNNLIQDSIDIMIPTTLDL